jgi:response regulator of citrate/malate metabolism
MEESNPARHILIIDDDLDDTEIFEEVLLQIDSRIKLTILYNCYDIIPVLNTIERLPDFLFIDVNLPGEDGIQCIKAIKENSKYSKIKIIIYCGALSQSVIDSTLENGAVSCFLKPSTIKEVHDLLEKILMIQPSE